MNRKLQVLIHIAIWGVVLVIPLTLQFRANPELDMGWKVHSLVSIGFTLIAFYSSFLVLSPLIIRRKSIFKSSLVFLAAALIIYAVKVGVILYLDTVYTGLYSKAKVTTSVIFITDFINYFVIMLVALLIQISINWFRDQKLKSEMMYQHQTQELALLKAQVNPHFFFNTLNNIYSLVYRKSDDAPVALLKLSEIMRYMLYESKSDTVPLPKELEQLENYLELEKLRLKDPDFISYRFEGNGNGIMIPPMLLISFVENAFKHGKRRVKNPGITIRISTKGKKLNFMVANYTLGRQPGSADTGGIGLKNISRRLELLYPGSHTLDIMNDSEQYIVTLELQSNPVQIK
jgi:LytS/YehU family sensor histidine kinase